MNRVGPSVCPAGVHFCTMWLLKSVIFDFLRPYFKCKIRETGWSFLAHSICTMWLLTHNSPSGHLQGIRNRILRGCDFGSPQAEHLKIDFEREISQNRIFSPAAGYFPLHVFDSFGSAGLVRFFEVRSDKGLCTGQLNFE